MKSPKYDRRKDTISYWMREAAAQAKEVQFLERLLFIIILVMASLLILSIT